MNKILHLLDEADKNKKALFHFNISNFEMIKAIVSASAERRTPVFLGVSEGERAFIGVKTLPALVKRMREEEGLIVFSNADHTTTIENIVEAAKAGFDAVTVDASDLPLDEAIKFVAKAREEALSINKDMVIEGEIGFIGHSSEMIKDLPYDPMEEKFRLTDPKDADKFVKETGVHMFSPAVGNFHGMKINGALPSPDFERIKLLKSVVRMPMVLHGGSGLSDEDLKKSAEAGISLIHISSELRLAYKKGMGEGLKAETLAPYKFAREAVEAVKNVVLRKLAIF